MKLSRTIAHAIRAMLTLARNETGAPMPCSEVARSGKMPERFLLQILRTMVNHGLLRSTRGVVGGYCLARPAAEISLGDIFDAFDCPHEPSAATLDAFEPGVRTRVLNAVESAARAARQELQRMMIADLRQTESTRRHPSIVAPITTRSPHLNAGPSGHH